MEGVRGDAELAGIIPRMFDFLFKSIAEADPDVEFTIKCTNKTFNPVYCMEQQTIVHHNYTEAPA